MVYQAMVLKVKKQIILENNQRIIIVLFFRTRGEPGMKKRSFEKEF